MGLYREDIVTRFLKSDGTTEVLGIKGFRRAKREVLKRISDVKSDFFGATLELSDGTFLKEIHL